MIFTCLSLHIQRLYMGPHTHRNYAFPLKGGPRSKIPFLNALWNIKVLKHYFLFSLPMTITQSEIICLYFMA